MDKEKQQDKKPIIKGRKVLVVKRKKAAPKKASGTLPTFRKRPQPTAVAIADADAVDDTAATEADDEFDTMLASLPNDCALGIQALQQNTDTCVSIPIPSDTGNYIKGVLELHLYRQLHADDSRGDTAVSRELADLLATNTIRKLSSPSRELNPLQVILSLSLARSLFLGVSRTSPTPPQKLLLTVIIPTSNNNYNNNSV